MPDKKRPITVREKKLVQGIAQGKTKRQAGLDAGYTGKLETVSTTVSDVLKKPNVQQELQRALTKHGIDIDSAIAPIGKGLRALKMNEFTGEVTEDIRTQLSASDRALKLLGIQQDQPTQVQFVQIINEQKNKYGI
jgi:arsenate reductase-like glutaredoxin family protein